MPRFSGLALTLLLAACAPLPQAQSPSTPAATGDPLAALPASFENTPACDGCLALTLTLRPDGTYLVRTRQGSAEFHDFGRWRREPGRLQLEGRRDPVRRYALQPPDVLDPQGSAPGGDLKRKAQAENLRGPFRLFGHYTPGERSSIKECLSGLTWPVGASRAGEDLEQAYRARPGRPPSVLVAVDGHFEDRPTPERTVVEMLVLQRQPEILSGDSCPSL